MIFQSMGRVKAVALRRVSQPHMAGRGKELQVNDNEWVNIVFIIGSGKPIYRKGQIISRGLHSVAE